MDPYIKVECGGHHYWTRVAFGQGLNPIWNETFTFEVNGKEPDVKFKLYDKEREKDDYLASGSYPLHGYMS